MELWNNTACEKHLGIDSYQELEGLHYWLYCLCRQRNCEGGCNQDRPAFGLGGLARIAPSLVTRTECQIFGVSLPRFALRVYMHDRGSNNGQGAGFVNARRLRHFRTSLPRKWEAPHGVTTVESANLSTPRKLLKYSSCIGDCVLKRPPFLKGWELIEREYGYEYGEGREVTGIPYVTSLPCSGLCAQSVCFMATAMLREHANSLFGISEISALACLNGTTLKIGGLHAIDIVNYFRDPKVGLGAHIQLLTREENQQRGKVLGTVEREKEETMVYQWELALKSYVLSGLPVALPVDANRMNGCGAPGLSVPTPSIADSNGLETGKATTGAEPHCVLVVGTRKNDQSAEWEFVLNDPATRPFVTASVRQLIAARSYYQTQEGKITRLSPPTMIPVTPAEVHMPLLPCQEAHNSIWEGSVLRLAVTLQQNFESYKSTLDNIPPLPLVDKSDLNGMEWRLWRLGDVINHLTQDRFVSTESHKNSADAAVSALLGKGWATTHWIWVQVMDKSIWFWNAQASPLQRGDFVSATLILLLAAAAPVPSDNWISGLDPAPYRKPPEDEMPPKSDEEIIRTPGLTRSLITSFHPGSLKDSVQQWPDGIPEAELYAFLQNDADQFLSEVRRPGYYTPAYKLMAFAHRKGIAESAAAAIHQTIVSGPKRIKISALATFIPEISARCRLRQKLAQDALKFCFTLAGILKSTHDHPVQSVEIVGGSRCDRVWLDQLDATVGLEDEERNEGLKRIAAQLSVIAPHAKSAGVKIALELEPGPLYLLRNLDNLSKLLEICKPDQVVSDVLRINLDVAHWAIIKRYTAAEVHSYKGILSKVQHVHISDHSAGHLGDLALTRKTPLNVFSEWLKILPDTADKRISLELECCPDSEELNLSVSNLLKLV